MFAQGPSQAARVVVAAVVSLALMVADHRYDHMETVRSALSVVTYPLHLLAESPVTLTRWVDETFSTRRELYRDNQRLHEQNLKLQGRLQKLAALESENMRLRSLLESSFKVGDRVLVAELLAVDLDPYKQHVLINRGSTSGVYEGQPVLDADAVMGQVTHVSPFTSTVVLITDTSHALPVQVNRNGLRTIAVGTGRVNALELPHLPNNADIREDDLLVTSGLGGRFPPGYPVARVVSVEREPGRPFAQVLATPSAHLDRTREALLVWTLEPRLGPGGDAASDAHAADAAEARPPADGDAP
ncbi:MAG: rod shape-determining protein MreC [Chromatiales bacterium]